mmetsp:Transcript_35569/g.117047  ORF Transcript_35569/g.117047 Transcript_35569/m.117047 type:complete len:235 (+) Transcript_35569:1049-1753(+)
MREEETEGSPIERKRYGVPFAGRGASVEQGRDGMKAGGLLRAIKIAEARCKVDALDCPEVMDRRLQISPGLALVGRPIPQPRRVRFQHESSFPEAFHALKANLPSVVEDIHLAVGNEIPSNGSRRCHVEALELVRVGVIHDGGAAVINDAKSNLHYQVYLSDEIRLQIRLAVDDSEVFADPGSGWRRRWRGRRRRRRGGRWWRRGQGGRRRRRRGRRRRQERRGRRRRRRGRRR